MPLICTSSGYFSRPHNGCLSYQSRPLWIHRPRGFFSTRLHNLDKQTHFLSAAPSSLTDLYDLSEIILGRRGGALRGGTERRRKTEESDTASRLGFQKAASFEVQFKRKYEIKFTSPVLLPSPQGFICRKMHCLMRKIIRLLPHLSFQ